MRLVLTSDSITNDVIANKIIEFVGKPANEIKFAIINEAYAYEFGSHKWLLQNLDAIRNYFGDNNLEFVNLLALDMEKIKERIELADVLLCCGGNPEYLQKVFEKTGFNKLLLEMLKEKVFVGISAGSMVLGKLPSLETLNAIYQVTDLFGVEEYLAYFNFSILPHTGKSSSNSNFKICLNESKKQSYPVYSLSNNSALVIEDNMHYLIGKDCYKLVNGKIVEKID